MQVKHRLTDRRAVVDGNAEGIAITFLGRDGGCRHQQMTEQRVVGRRRVGQHRHRLLGTHQHMHRRLRIDVAKGDALLILKNDVGRNLARNDFLEQGHLAHVMSSAI